MPSWFLRSTGLLRLAPASAASTLALLLGLLVLGLVSVALQSSWRRRLMSALMTARLLLRRLLRPLRVLSRRTALAVLGRSRDWAPGIGFLFSVLEILLPFFLLPFVPSLRLLRSCWLKRTVLPGLLRGRPPFVACLVLRSTGMAGTKGLKILETAIGSTTART